jgi:hypothetical protein
MEQWPGVDLRLKESMRASGYWNTKTGRPDVLRFCMEHRYVPQMIYKYLNDGVTPDRCNMERLAADLGVNWVWLYVGDEGGVSKALANPRKRGRGIACLLAALGLSTIGMVPAAASPDTSMYSATYDLPVIGSAARRLWRAVLRLGAGIDNTMQPRDFTSDPVMA